MANKKVSQLTSKPSVLVTDLFPIADPSTGQLYKTTISDLGTAIGSGVSSVNGLVGAVVLDTDDIQELVSPTNKWFTDTRARAALSASSPLAYNSGTGVFSIPAATSSQNGYLTSTDWTTFNSKQPALSGTGFVKISGTTISYDNTAYLPLAGGTLTGALFGASASFSGFVGFGGNTSPLAAIDVTGAGIFSSSITATRLILSGGTSPTGLYFGHTDKVVLANYTVGGGLDFETNGGNITMQLSSSGNLSTTGGITSTTGNFSSNVQIGGSAIPGNSNSFYNTSAETSVLIKQTSNPSQIALSIWNNAITGDNRFIRFYTESTPTSRGYIYYDRTLDKLTLIGEGSGLSFNGASIFSSSIISNNSITAIGTSTAGFVTSLLVKNPSTNSASAVKIGFDGGGTTWGEIGTSYNSNSPYMAFFIRANSEKMRITDSGNVGIGTTSPTGTYGKLSVAGGISILNDNNAKLEIGRYSSGASNSYIKLGSSSNSLRITSNDDITDLFTFTNSGNLLINTTSDNSKGKLQVIGNTYTEGVYIATGQFSQGGGATSTFYTFSNSSTNRVFLVTLRQSGSAGNTVTGMAFTYGGGLQAYNLGQDNTNPVLYLTLSASGLELRLTTGSGYGTTTWDWTITQIK